jgi:hypothetical protein
LRVVPADGLAPSRVVLAWDATITDAARDDFITAALACAGQTIDPTSRT